MRFVRGGQLVLVAVLSGCGWLEFSPNQTYVPATERHLTTQNLARLASRSKAATDTLRFVFVGDCQRFYDEADDFVASVNQQRDLDFVVIAGDISDFGLVREMRWINRRLQKLKVPYLTVIGNHDEVGNGRAVYESVFGPLNYSFLYGGTRFICLDTNGRESSFAGKIPNLSWLGQQLADTAGSRRSIVLCHVPPTDNDFDPALVTPYVRAMRSSSQLVFHLAGHIHRFTDGEPFQDGVRYLTAYNFKKRRYNILSVWGQRQFHLETVAYAPAP
jgi:3',5'-cyclic AMP phosphodiesterase CpdA